MKIEFERYDFSTGIFTKVEREIDSREVLRANPFFQLVAAKPGKEKRRAAPENDPA